MIAAIRDVAEAVVDAIVEFFLGIWDTFVAWFNLVLAWIDGIVDFVWGATYTLWSGDIQEILGWWWDHVWEVLDWCIQTAIALANDAGFEITLADIESAMLTFYGYYTSINWLLPVTEVIGILAATYVAVGTIYAIRHLLGYIPTLNAG